MDLFFESLDIFIQKSHYAIALISVMMVPPLLVLVPQKNNLAFFAKRYLNETYKWKELRPNLSCFILYFLYFSIPVEKFYKNHVELYHIILIIKFIIILFSVIALVFFIGKLYFHIANIFFVNEFNNNENYYFNLFKKTSLKTEKVFKHEVSKNKKSYEKLKKEFREIYDNNFPHKDSDLSFNIFSISSKNFIDRLRPNKLTKFFKKLKEKKIKVTYEFEEDKFSVHLYFQYPREMGSIFENEKSLEEDFDKCFKENKFFKKAYEARKVLLEKFKTNYYYITYLIHKNETFQLINEINLMREIVRSDECLFVFKDDGQLSPEAKGVYFLKDIFSAENSNLHLSVKKELFDLWLDIFYFIGLKNGVQIADILNMLFFAFESNFFNSKIISERSLVQIIRGYFYENIKITKRFKEKNYDTYLKCILYNALKSQSSNKTKFGFDFFIDLSLSPSAFDTKRDPSSKSFEQIFNSNLIQFSSYCLYKKIEEFNSQRARIYKLLNEDKIIVYIEEIIEKGELKAHEWDFMLKQEKSKGESVGGYDLDFYKFLLEGFLKNYLNYHAVMRKGLNFLQNQNIPDDMKGKLNYNNIDELVAKLKEQFKVNQRKQPLFR